MPRQLSSQTEALIQRHLATGRYASEDELLREALVALDEDDADWAAIQEGLAALDEPTSWMTLDEADDDLRRRHNIPAP